MKVIKKQLRRTINRVLKENISHATHGECPSFQEWESLVHVAQSMLMGRYYEGAGRGFIKIWARYKKKGMNIPSALYDETPECMREVMSIGKNQGTLTEDGYEAICEAWARDADYYSEFDWNYEF